MVASKDKRPNVVGSLLSLVGITAAIGVVTAGMVTPTLAVTSVLASDGVAVFNSLPEYLEPVSLQAKSTIYAKKGDGYTVLAEFYDKNRIPVESDEISQWIKDATVAVEDNRFFEHNGVDLPGVARAVAQNLISGETESGASTITMQLARIQLEEQAEWTDDEEQIAAAKEVTATRKIKEMKLALGLEKQFSKDEILTDYLNTIFFGGHVYGIEAASQYFFGKSAKDVTLPEAAMLSGLFPSPNTYAPDKEENLEAALNRRNFVLKRMLDQGSITQAEYDEAVATPIETNITPVERGCAAAGRNAFFCDYVVQVIRNDSSFGETQEERMALLRRGGLQIYTTLDLELQKTAQESVNYWTPKEGRIGGAAVSLKVGTGDILAMVQNRNYDPASEHEGENAYTAVNYNTTKAYGGSSGFQVGSTYKTFTLIEWLKSGRTLNETLNSRVREFNQSDFTVSCGETNYGTWKPSNVANFPSRVTVLRATRDSINTGFVDMALKLDLCDIRDTAEALGVERADGTELSLMPSAIIGAADEIAPMTMAAAYGGIANDGIYCKPIAITRVVDVRTGEERENIPTNDCTQAIDKNVARKTTEALQSVLQTSYGRTAHPGNVVTAGKTGTTNDAVQNWMVGYTTEVVTAAWTGNAIGGQKISGLDFYSHGVRGNMIRNRIFQEVMREAGTIYGGTSFARPDGPVGDTSNQATVPNVAGMTYEQAVATIEQAGFTAEQGGRVESKYPEGYAVRTNPASGTVIGKGASVWIYRSEGGKSELPGVIGMSRENAVDALRSAGFSNISVREVPGGEPNRVTDVNGTEGRLYDSDREIVITVSTGDVEEEQ